MPLWARVRAHATAANRARACRDQSVVSPAVYYLAETTYSAALLLRLTKTAALTVTMADNTAAASDRPTTSAPPPVIAKTIAVTNQPAAATVYYRTRGLQRATVSSSDRTVAAPRAAGGAVRQLPHGRG